jgi:hypothetical protein
VVVQHASQDARAAVVKLTMEKLITRLRVQEIFNREIVALIGGLACVIKEEKPALADNWLLPVQREWLG